MLRSKTKFLIVTLLGFFCLSSIASIASADIHLIKTMRMEYGGYPRPALPPIEIWLSPTCGHIIYKNKITIAHYDRGVKWIVDLNDSTYKEIPIEPDADEKETEEKLHNQGFVYEPEFNWILQTTDEDTVLCGAPCKKFIVEGDADYAEKIIEIWAAEDIGIELNVNEKSLHYFQGQEMADLIDQFQELKGLNIMLEKSTSEEAIAQIRILTIEIIKLEDAVPPDGIYQLPHGLKRID
jgi:hypothetical protein